MSDKTVAVYVPARLGSKRTPRKNLRDLGGQSLILRCLTTLKQTKYWDSTFLNTESIDIISAARPVSPRVHVRPLELAQDNTTTDEILLDFFNSHSEYANIAVINPTAPFLSASDINRFIDKFLASQRNSAFSTHPIRRHLLQDGQPVNFRANGKSPRTQDLQEVEAVNFACIAFQSEFLKKVRDEGVSIFSGSCITVSLDERSAFDIDTEFDFRIAEALLEKDVRGSTFDRGGT